MNGTLKLIGTTLAYADVGVTSNPTRKYADWATQRTYAVANPKTEPYTVDPGATLTVFNGVRTTAVDGTTQFTLALSTLAPTRYRFTFSAGTDPILRTARALALATKSVTVTVNNNLTVTMASAALDWTAVQVGDTVFIPDTTTGDAAAPFNPLNVGYWTVLAVAGDGSSVQLARPSGTGFVGFSEVVTVASNAQVLAFSAAGVQVNDKVRISAGFSTTVQGTYKIIAVTSKWFEITSTLPLPTGVSALPGATGIQFFSSAKRYMRVEGDQSFILRWNGDASNLNQIDPWAPADGDQTGWDEKCGPVWSAIIVNLSPSAPLNLNVISAE